MAFLTKAPIAVLIALWCVGLRPMTRLQAQAQTLEPDVKAAFLYNFTKYIDWPSGAFPDNADPFRMCVLSDEEFARKVQAIVEGESAKGRSLQLVKPELSELQRCHILFVGRQDIDKASAAIAGLSGRPVLIVGDSPKFLDRGGAILFVVEQNRVRFDIDLRATTRARLTVSSKLLRIARNVREGQHP
jgi:hypothetical protein